jgi:hypothetical protein
MPDGIPSAPGAHADLDRDPLLPPPSAARQIIDLMTGTWLAQALYAAVCLELPDLVGAGCRDAESLAEHAGADPDAISRLMRLLIAFGIFGSSEAGYQLRPVSESLCKGAEGSMRDLCLVYGGEFHRAWGHADVAFKTGLPGFGTAFGRPLHEHLTGSPQAQERFSRAMNAGAMVFADVAASFDFTRSATLTDVAGGDGTLLATILRAHPHLNGTLYERAHLMAPARHQLWAEIQAGRAATVTGDMFQSVPGGSDVYVLCRVLQDWDDHYCAELLRNCRRAMTAPSAHLLIVDRVINPERLSKLPLLWDVHLLMISGGRERTLAEYGGLLAGAGLRIDRADQLSLETSLLVARPAG